jgi:hypothetical protein
MHDVDERLEHVMAQLAEPVDTVRTLDRVRARMLQRRRQRQLKIAATLVGAVACAAIASTQLVSLGAANHRLRATARRNPPAVTVLPPSLTVPPPTSTLPQAPAFQFHQDAFSCIPDLTPPIRRTWQVSAPRTTQIGVTSVSIGLRNKMAGSMGDRGRIDPQIMLPAPDIELRAQVTTPDGTTYASRTLRLLPRPPDGWIDVSYPTDFPHARDLTPGTYTTVWVTPLGPIACDGFTIG